MKLPKVNIVVIKDTIDAQNTYDFTLNFILINRLKDKNKSMG